MRMDDEQRFFLGEPNSQNGVLLREWFCIGCSFIPDFPPEQGEKFFGFRQLAAVDISSAFSMGYHHIISDPDTLDFAAVVPFLENLEHHFGVPLKGYVLSHSCWLSSVELLVDEDTAESGEFLEEIGVSFGPMTDFDKQKLVEWAEDKGCKMLFDADALAEA